MTVIFQLFCAEDIKKLGPDGPTRLFNFMQGVLADYKSTNPYGLMKVNEPAKFILEASDTTKLTSGSDTPQQILDAIHDRFEQVFQQLMAPPPRDKSGSIQLDTSQELFEQISNQISRLQGFHEQENNRILRWAISCEVNNFNFYYSLLQVKKKAYDWFLEQTGNRPKGPDSLYSPFNPLHPLYNLFYNLEQQSTPPEEGEGPTPTP